MPEQRQHPTLKLGALEVSVDLGENTVMVSFAGQGLALVVVPAMGADGEQFERLFLGELGVGPEGAVAAKLAAEVAARPRHDDELAGRSAEELTDLIVRAREELARHHAQAIVEALRAATEEHNPGLGATKVVFGTEEYDNGHFYDDSGLVVFPGSQLEMDFHGTGVADLLTELSEEHGPLTSNSELVVDLVTGEVTAH
jgi:hypothetical protein